jgi:hypothetical protein
MQRAPKSIRHTATAGLVALASWGALAAPAGANARSPLPASNYTARSVCPPPASGHASCMALTLVAASAEARAHDHPLAVVPNVRRTSTQLTEPLEPSQGGYGFTPQALHTAYTLPTSETASQTVAVVDAYNDPTAESDLAAYDKEFALPACTTANGCFKQINEQGESTNLPFPQSSQALATAEAGDEAEVEEAEEATGWGVEMSLDVQTVRAICQTCKIVLVEASSTHYPDLKAAERAAEQAHATEISNSWGGAEEAGLEGTESPFNHPGTVITASAGDDGFLNWDLPHESVPGHANFPASSPHVVAVGGTRLEVNGETGAWQQESVWNGHGAGGGGCSTVFPAPIWQTSLSNWASVGCKDRAVADVSADADPYTGVAVYDTDNYGCEENGNPYPGWCVIGGTSLSSPLIASTFALAGGAHGVSYPAKTLYANEAQHSAGLRDVIAGSNGKCTLGINGAGVARCTSSEEAAQCSQDASCLAGFGYDGPTGVGTPDGITGFEPASTQTSKEQEEKTQAEEVPTVEKKERLIEEILASVPTVTPPAPIAPPATVTGTGPVLRLSGLALSVKAIVALNQGRAKISRIGFVFTSTAPLRVIATLAKHVRVHRHLVWKNVGRPLLGTAKLGNNSWHLTGHGTLGRGAYRLTLATSGVPSKSITFQIG